MTIPGLPVSDEDVKPVDRETMPFVAPCRQLGFFAPFGWLRRGMADLGKAPQQSLMYGFFMALIMAVVVWLAWTRGSQYIMLAMLGGFVFIAPLACIGLYAISAQLERGQEPSMARSLRAAFKRHLGNEMIFAVALLVVFMIWARSAMMITVFFPVGSGPELADLVPFLTIGTVVGAFFAIVTFSVSAFSLPMIMHRDVDSITAIVTSINAVLRNKMAMMVWLALIMAGLVIGMMTAFVGLIVILPVIGYGAWHGYLETIDADQFPRHSVGITSIPRQS
jgi:uncharacterized membrane protein